MAQADTTFDYHFNGVAVLNETPAGVDTKEFDYHYNGVAVVADEEAPSGHPTMKRWLNVPGMHNILRSAG